MPNSYLLQSNSYHIDGEYLFVQDSRLLGTAIGTELRLALSGRERIRAKMLDSSSGNQEVALQIVQKLPLPVRTPLCLVVGLCRPQTWKKVLETATTCGIAEVHVLRCERSEKSFFESDVYQPAAIKRHTEQVLEQIWDGRAPVVKLHDRFLPFVEDELASMPNQRKFCFDGSSSDVPLYRSGMLMEERTSTSGNVCCCIGSEAGWNDFERDTLSDICDNTLSFGDRILRTEQAVQAVCFAEMNSFTNTAYQ